MINTTNNATKKVSVVEILNNAGIKANVNTGKFEMSQNKFSKIYEMDELAEYNIVKSKKFDNVWAIRSRDNKKTFAVIEIKKITKTKKAEKAEEKENQGQETVKPEKAKAKKETTVAGGKGHKVKGAGYIIVFKNKDDKKETVKNDLTSCAEIKAWLKTISKKQLEYLRIYDEQKNECRKSAWVG